MDVNKGFLVALAASTLALAACADITCDAAFLLLLALAQRAVSKR
jgi:hypothetical protein